MRLVVVTAVLDACVLYPAPLRDFLMWLALAGRFRARWSAQIHDEWQRNLLKNRLDLTTSQLKRTAALMNQAIPDALVGDYQHLIAGLVLPDADDRHVLAAAICSAASVIVTFNQKDFPADVLRGFGIEAQHPDFFVRNLFDLAPTTVVGAAQRHRQQLTHPPVQVDQYLDVLSRLGLEQTVQRLRSFREVL